MVLKDKKSLHNSQGDGVEQDLTQLAVIIVCDASSGCDEVDDLFLHQKQTQW